ncbi:MAG: SpoIID/LytB domain-containing protein [Desulfotomaculales bacterium]
MRWSAGLIAGAVVCSLLVGGCTRQAPRKPVAGAPQSEPTITLFINETGEKKQIKLEEYVAGVVAAEMEPTWPVNALAAQAILARTFTLENMKTGRVKQLRGTDVSTSPQESQAYNPSRINEQVRQAVARTRGEVATYQGNYVKAWFNACDGGVTASAAEGLGYTKTPTPYLKSGIKDDCLAITTPENRAWETRVPLEQVRAAVQKVTGQDPGEITSARIVEYGPSGRAQKLQLGKVTVSAPALRLALGSEWVRSTFFTSVSIEGGRLVLKGKGFGHGVGMCQWGAKKLAEQGRSPEDIVKFYYQGIEIQKLWK